MPKNFSNFALRSTAASLSAAYLVGYDPNTNTEIRGSLQNILSAGGESDSQTLSFNQNTGALSISNGNTVSLSALGGGGNQTLSFNQNTGALSISNGNTISLSALSATISDSYFNKVGTAYIGGDQTGNTRGLSAIDIQIRTSAGKVVSGQLSQALGTDNTVSGESSVAIGNNNVVEIGRAHV